MTDDQKYLLTLIPKPEDESIELEWMPLELDKFLAGTNSFSAAEIGGYLLLIIEQFKKGFIKNEKKIIKKISKISEKKSAEILSKFVELDGNLYNVKCAETRKNQLIKYKNNSKAGQIGAEARWKKDSKTNSEQIATASEPHSDRTDLVIADIKKEDINNNTVINNTHSHSTREREIDPTLYVAHDKVVELTAGDEVWCEEAAMALFSKFPGITTQKFKQYTLEKLAILKLSGTTTKYPIGTVRGILVNDYGKADKSEKKQEPKNEFQRIRK